MSLITIFMRRNFAKVCVICVKKTWRKISSQIKVYVCIFCSLFLKSKSLRFVVAGVVTLKKSVGNENNKKALGSSDTNNKHFQIHTVCMSSLQTSSSIHSRLKKLKANFAPHNEPSRAHWISVSTCLVEEELYILVRPRLFNSRVRRKAADPWKAAALEKYAATAADRHRHY